MQKWTAAGLGGLCLALAGSGLAWAQETGAPAKTPETQTLAFRFIGPKVGNRVAAIAGVPGDPNTWYAGAASGGVWKSTDGGFKWEPVFDNQPVAAIGALAVAASDPKTVWAGTGEAWAIRDIDVTGDGVYKSEDGGKTWRNMGLKETGRIGRIVVDPRDAKVVYVCALGRLSGPQQERGVFKTVDGGETWKQVLFADPNTGCSGLALDPNDSKTLFAGLWQVEMHTYGEFSGGPGSAVYVSHDAGAMWTRLDGRGLPRSPVGKIDVAVAPTDSRRVYALIQTDKQGSMWRSDDGGASWKVVSWDRTLIGRAGYYIRLAVSPTDKDKVLVSSSGFHVSTDGGVTFPEVRWGGDNHDIWMDPTNPDRFAISFDGGLAITANGGKAMREVTLPIGQMYHVAVDDRVPYWVYGNMQDDGTMRAPVVPIGDRGGWEFKLGGCESGFTFPDPRNPDVVWSSCYGSEVTRWDAQSRTARSVSPWLHTLDSAPNQTRYRCHWTPPLAPDPFDKDTVYFGCQYVLKTTDAGQSWAEVSPDLSTRDPSRIVSSGGIIGDNLGQFYGEVVFAIAPSQIQRGLVWAGTNDGKVWYTLTGGGRWTDVTKNIPGMPAWGTVTSIEPSHFDPATAYVTVDVHLMDDRDPYIFKTADLGKTWTKISGGLPKGPLAYVRNVSEDPNQKGLLFAGTGNALYYSLDDGGTWARLKDGLPPSPVTWTVVQKRFHDLVVSTYGRGWYVLEDISALEEMARKATTDDVRLFAPRATYRLGRTEAAFVDFALKDAPKAEVAVEILDEAGQPVRRLEQTAHAGLNRVRWDLRYEDLKTVILRTAPPEDPHIWEEARFKGKASRPVYHWGMSIHQRGPLVVPGRYQVRLTVDGKSVTAPLEILIDPNGPAPAADLQAALKLQLRIKDDVARVSDKVNLLEQMRHQLEEMKAKTAQGDAEYARLDAMDQKLQAVEYEMFSKDLAPSDDKYYVSAYKIYFNLLWLNAEISSGGGDVAGGVGRGPTAAQPRILAMLEEQLATAEGHYQALMTRDVAAFNQAQVAKGLPELSTTLTPPDDKEKGARVAEAKQADEDDYTNDD
jgi:photosystem II stability/assembly factor-like uncharacterized protein